MAKQTFTTGQVLTAAQLSSLQQTAMLGGSATAKTTSYTLVAADAGTVVSVNSTSATTITVNTGLFAAGDTVTIQNWGSGAVTITAGTATVNTAGSLIVPQYDGGVLYFTSASAAIYFDWVQAGATSPLTTKGDIWGYSTSDARIPVGANDTVLTADSTQALGVKWAAVSGGASSFVGCVLSNTSENISYSNNTVTTLALNYEAIDTDAFHDNSTNNSRITIPSGKAGKYRISAVAFWGANTTGYRSIRILKNGSTVKEANVSPNMGNVGPSMVVTAILDLAVSDYVQFNVLQNSGGDLSLFYGSGQYGWYEAEFLGA